MKQEMKKLKREMGQNKDERGVKDKEIQNKTEL
jgi:hypothetical protein